MHTHTELLASAEANNLNATQLIAWCSKTGLPAIQACDALALQLAQQYMEGRFDYEFCDRAINSLMSLVTSPEFFAVTDREIPALMQSVYLAFDEGEFIHSGDTEEISPELKYTRPMIQSILDANHGA